jgi:hypothetical protein
MGKVVGRHDLILRAFTQSRSHEIRHGVVFGVAGYVRPPERRYGHGLHICHRDTDGAESIPGSLDESAIVLAARHALLRDCEDRLPIDNYRDVTVGGGPPIGLDGAMDA